MSVEIKAAVGVSGNGPDGRVVEGQILSIGWLSLPRRLSTTCPQSVHFMTNCCKNRV